MLELWSYYTFAVLTLCIWIGKAYSEILQKEFSPFFTKSFPLVVWVWNNWIRLSKLLLQRVLLVNVIYYTNKITISDNSLCVVSIHKFVNVINHTTIIINLVYQYIILIRNENFFLKFKVHYIFRKRLQSVECDGIY